MDDSIKDSAAQHMPWLDGEDVGKAKTKART
jgi:hypothetical protein